MKNESDKFISCSNTNLRPIGHIYKTENNINIISYEYEWYKAVKIFENHDTIESIILKCSMNDLKQYADFWCHYHTILYNKIKNLIEICTEQSSRIVKSHMISIIKKMIRDKKMTKDEIVHIPFILSLLSEDV